MICKNFLNSFKSLLNTSLENSYISVFSNSQEQIPPSSKPILALRIVYRYSIEMYRLINRQ